MALPSIEGLDFLQDVNTAGLFTGVGKIILAILIFAFIAGVMAIVMLRVRKKKNYNKRIHWFEEVNQAMIPVDEDWARELTIPNTNVTLFYIKSKDLYLPRGTRRMGKNAYWYAIRNNREIVNFTMTNLNDVMKEAKIDFDHTDMRYAKENLLALIKRNYRDGSKPWWKEYKDVIATIIFIFVMSLAFFFLLSKIGSLISSLDILIGNVNELIKSAQVARSGSGVA